jgi:succinate dehydrogenase / fumarate reductase cytochrome b subunit
MGLLGTLILLFLILHLSHFWVPNRSHQGWLLGEELNLYERMKVTFSELWVVIVYVAGCISLCWHLIHGFQSAFRTLGLRNQKYLAIINSVGVGFAVIVSLAFALMPVSMYLNWVS